MNIIETVKTLKNNEIQLFDYKPTDYKSVVLFIGVVHGDEPQGNFLINKYINELTENKRLVNNRLLFIPCLNPDGMQSNTRQNANMVDINRNFPTKNWEKTEKNEFWGGDEANSEIETKFLVKIINKFKPNYVVTFHAPFKIINYDGDAKEIAEKVSELSGYPIQADIGYPTPGSFGTYSGIELKIPTLTVEVDEALDNEAQWEKCKNIFIFFENI